MKVLFYAQQAMNPYQGDEFVEQAARHVWTRHCPCCGRWLTKGDPMAPWSCLCGWQSG
jgi:hypothetical protein